MPKQKHSDLELITDRIYEACAVPELWRGVLDDLAELSGCMGGILLVADPARNVRHVESDSLVPLMTAFHRERWMDRNTRAARLMQARHPGFVLDSDLYTSEEMDSDPLYLDLLRRYGGGWAVGTMVPVPSGDLLIFNIERSYAAGPVPRDAVARLDSLRPHLARAALVSARLRLERARTTVDVLERVGLPAAAVQQDGRVLAANALLERLDGHFVFTARDRLRISNPSANALFDQALTHVASPSANELVVGSIPVPAVEGSPPLVIHLVPVRGAGYDVFSAAVTVLIVTPVTGSEAPSTALLSGLFDLTASESRLAAVIATGVPPREAAAKLGISEQTARTTLKRVFMKVGVSRQSELAALLSRLAKP